MQRRALTLRTVNREPAPWAYRYPVRWLVRALLPLVARRHWSGQHHLPLEGGAIVVANHISNIDPLLVGEYLVYGGRWPRFLAKEEVFRWPIVGWVARSTDQIPVHRDSERARDALAHARAALARGKLVVVYPEGTISADPDLWPMTGRRGAAQLALETGLPVVPLAQWGAHRILGGRYVEWRRLLHGRQDVHLEAGPPVDLTEFRARIPENEAPSKALLDAVTEQLLDTLTRMVGDLRGEQPPAGRWDMRVGGRVDSPSQ